MLSYRYARLAYGFMFATSVSVLFLSGCSQKPAGISFGKVSGTVTLDGAPLPDALVTFEPEMGRPSWAMTNAEGIYALNYRGHDWGAVTGPHTVRITTANRFENPETDEVRIVKELLPATYHARSTLTADVKPGENVIDFALEKSPSRK